MLSRRYLFLFIIIISGMNTVLAHAETIQVTIVTTGM
jgi:hypothetical protein